jgi:phage gpG-like protein
MEYKVQIKGLNELIKKLEAATKESVLREGLGDAAQYVAGWSKKWVSGPRSKTRLGVITGNLHASIVGSKAGEIEKSGNSYIARIGTNIVYARIHEFGFDGIQTVRAHARRTGTFKILGSSGRLKKGGSTLLFKGVSTRHMRMPARPFLRPAIEDENNKIMILDILKERIQKSINGESA